MKYENILFDLDGTVSDTGEGICRCFEETILSFGADPSAYELRRFLGPPLKWSFLEVFGEEKTAETAVERYRKNYLEKWIFVNSLFPGMKELLSSLHSRGKRCFVATSKYEPYAVKILEKLEVIRNFVGICGSDAGQKRAEKAEVLRYLLDRFRLDPKRCVLIGDTFYDLQGAAAVGMDAVGVTYGYGSEEELRRYPSVKICRSVTELRGFLLSSDEGKPKE